MRVGIVDFGAGNLASVANMIHFAGGDAEIVATPEAVAGCDRIVLPGVGAAGTGIAALRARGLDEALELAVRRGGRPMLGICLGMQMLGERLTEFGEHRGLGWIAGDVVHIEAVCAASCAPHMGWNRITPEDAASGFFDGSAERLEFYFAHSYVLRPEDPAVVAATADNDGVFAAAVAFDNVLATQFHPEKSQVPGERLMQAFLAWQP